MVPLKGARLRHATCRGRYEVYRLLPSPLVIRGVLSSTMPHMYGLRTLSLPPDDLSLLFQVQHFGVSPKQLKSVPIISHSPNTSLLKRSIRMVDVSQAEALGIQKHGSLQKMKELFEARWRERHCKIDMAFWKWEESDYLSRKPRFRSIPVCLVDDNYPASEWRLQGTTTFPYWDRQTAKLEPGAYCRACTYDYKNRHGPYSGPHMLSMKMSSEPYYRAFLEADLPKHFLHCDAAKANYNFLNQERSRHYYYRRTGSDFYVDVNRAARREPNEEQDVDGKEEGSKSMEEDDEQKTDEMIML